MSLNPRKETPMDEARENNLMRAYVNVTAADIRNAIERNSQTCMAAEALKRDYPNLRYVSVDIQTTRATDPKTGLRHIWLTPASVQRMIIRFDKGLRDELRPFSFQLRTGQVVASGGRGSSKSKKKKLKTSLQPPRGAGPGSVPNRIGGRPPPKVGRERSFGLRSFELSGP